MLSSSRARRWLLAATSIIAPCTEATASNSSAISMASSGSPSTSSSLSQSTLSFPWDNASFRRSPQCDASLSLYPDEVLTETATWGSVTTTFPVTDTPHCCDYCSITFATVDVRYWPVTSTNTDCLSSITGSYSSLVIPSTISTLVGNNTANIPIPYPTTGVWPVEINGSTETVPSNPATAVGPDGFTYTSPYIYVVFETIGAEDECGSRGGVYTSITWSYLPGQLSTIRGRMGPTSSFNLQDLPCPPSSYTSGFPYGWDPTRPYAPVIAPVPQLWEIDPAFKVCDAAPVYDGLDPPSTLTPAAALAHPSTTPAAGQQISSTPTRTTAPSAWDPVTVGAETLGLSTTPAGAGQTPSPPGPDHTQDPAPESSSASDPPAPDPTADPGPASPVIIVGGHTLTSSGIVVIVAGQTLTPDGLSIQVSGTSIYLGLGGTSTIPVPTAPAPPGALAVVIDGLTLTPTGEALVVSGQTIKPGSPAFTIDGTPVSLATGASALAIGSSTVTLSTATPAPAPLTVDGQTLTPTNGGYVVDGQALRPDGTAITVAGTRFSLESSGSRAGGGGLVVKSTQTFALAATASGDGGIAGAIWSALGGSQMGGEASTGGPVVATSAGGSATLQSGSAARRFEGRGWGMLVWIGAGLWLGAG